jgi:[acyl-carrier-protein] S-malonyltransferase
MSYTLLFPGQGSQAVGMGKAMAENFATAKEVFQEVDDALNEHFSSLIFEGPENDLTLTQNAQPAIMATSVAAFRVLEKETDLHSGRDVNFVAGHSLGEYSALCASGAISLADTAKLLRTRGNAMQEAVSAGKGMMAAIIGPEIDTIESICEQASTEGVCEVANDNSPGQVVISGENAGVEKAMELAKEAGARRALPLAVSAPFHSSLIASAANVMKDALANTEIHAPKAPVVANVHAVAIFTAEDIRDALVSQVTGRVRWRESMHYLKEQNVTQAIEIGNGKVLAGLMKRCEPDISIMSIGQPEDIDQYVKAA